MQNKESVFLIHYNRLMEITKTDELEQEIDKLIQDPKVTHYNKQRIKLDLMPLKGDLIKLQTYITNSMLKYQGHGVCKMLNQ